MYDTTKPYNARILELVKTTQSAHVNPDDIHHVDGIGTKGVYHWHFRTFEEAALDGLRANYNDLAMERARPYLMLDHIMVPADDSAAILAIVETLVHECKTRKIAIVGGETAIHDNMEGMELSIAMTGRSMRRKPNRALPGDILLGLRSNGLHTNGYTTLRRVFGTEYRREFTTPMACYLDDVLAADERHDIHAMMHITGGAYTRLTKILNGSDAQVNRFPTQPIFQELHHKGVSDEEMYRTFNCGIGFVLAVSRGEVHDVCSSLDAIEIGEVTDGTGKVTIASVFSDTALQFFPDGTTSND